MNTLTIPRTDNQDGERPLSLLGAVSVLGLLILWVVLTTRFPGAEGPLVSELKLPGPRLVFQAALQLKWNLVIYSATTLFRVVAGLCIGSGIGLLTGLGMTRYKVFRDLLYPIIEALRPCPPIALIPFVIFYLGLGSQGQIFIVGLGCFMIFVITTLESVKTVEPKFIQAAQSLGADSLSVFRAVILPAITPHLVAAARVAAAASITLTCAAEYLGAQGGLGFLIRNARTTLNTESILLGIILLATISWLLDFAIRSIGAGATRWLERPFEQN